MCVRVIAWLLLDKECYCDDGLTFVGLLLCIEYTDLISYVLLMLCFYALSRYWLVLL